MFKILLFVLILLVVSVFVVFFSAPSIFIALIKSRQTQYPLSFKQLFGMYLRKQNLNKMVEVNNVIQLNNLQITLGNVEHYYLQGGNIDLLLEEAIKCKENYKEFNFSEFLKANS